MQRSLLSVRVHDFNSAGAGLGEDELEEVIAILAGCGVEDFRHVPGEEVDDEDVGGAGEEVAGHWGVASDGSPEEGCDRVGLGAGDVGEEGGEEVGEAPVREEEGGDVVWGFEGGGDEKEELVGE